MNRDIRNAFFGLNSKGLNDKTIDEVLSLVKNIEGIESAFSLYSFYSNFVVNNDYKEDLPEKDVMFMIRVEYAKYLLHHKIHHYLLTEDESKQITVLINRNDFKSKLITKLFNKVDLFLNKLYNVIDIQDFNPNIIYQYMYNAMAYSLSVAYVKQLNDFITNTNKVLYNFLHALNSNFGIEIFIHMYNTMTAQMKNLERVNRHRVDNYFETLGIKNSNGLNWTLDGYNLGNADILSEVFNQIVDNKVNNSKLFLTVINYLYSNNYIDMGKEIIDKTLALFIEQNNIKIKLGKPLVFYSKKHINLLTRAMVEGVFESDAKMAAVENLILYPLYKERNEIYYESGKLFFANFIEELFNKEAKMFFEIFDNPDTVIREQESIDNITSFELRTRNYYDLLRSFWRKTSKSELLLILDPNYYEDSVAKQRFYITIGVLKHLNKNVENILFDSLTQLFQLASHKYNLTLNDQFFVDNRGKKEQNLINLLSNFDITPNQTTDYFMSIIDNEVATIEQMDRFPVLEQVGDAIYGFCVNQLMLKDILIEDPSIFSKIEIGFVQASFQVELAEKIGLEGCYIHNKFLESKFKLNYVEKVLLDANDTANHHDKKTYLADSLEMVIGSIYFDQGIEAAIRFTTKVLTDYNEYFNELYTVTIPSHENKLDLNWEEYELYTRVYPQLNVFYSGQYTLLDPFGFSLSKLLSILVYGNETKEKRSDLRRISYRRAVSMTRMVDSNTYLAYHYLNEGFEKAITVYKNEVLPKILKETGFDK